MQLNPTTSAPAATRRRRASLNSTPSEVQGLPSSVVFKKEAKVTTAGKPGGGGGGEGGRGKARLLDGRSSFMRSSQHSSATQSC